MQTYSRRQVLGGLAGLGLTGALAACGQRGTDAGGTLIGPHSPQVGAADAARRTSGRTVTARLSPRPVTVDLAGRQARTWAYDDQLARQVLRARPGDRLQVSVANGLPADTTVHWHGVNLRNDMDGVPGLTQSAIKPAAAFTYDFLVPDQGTYWFHSHQGLQLDRGLYGALIIDDPNDPGGDHDAVIVLDDWLDGIDGTPDDEMRKLTGGTAMGGHPMSGMPGMSMGGMTSPALGGDAGDVAYPLHLMNGRPTADPYVLTPAAGSKLRLRLINAGADTAYRFAVAGHALTLVATDGRDITPVTVDTVLVGMGERYDVELTALSGTWSIWAAAEGKGGGVGGVLRTTGTLARPAVPRPPAELAGRLARYPDMAPVDADRLPPRNPDRTYRVALTGSMTSYSWGLGGDAHRLTARPGERIRLIATNHSAMWHPMHLHGHTVALAGNGLRKDTVRVLPMQTVTVDFDADNPGQWMYHCHNIYHQDRGMSTTLAYRT